MISENKTENDWFQQAMQAKVDEHWSTIVDCEWEDASLEDQFGLATSWDLMLDD